MNKNNCLVCLFFLSFLILIKIKNTFLLSINILVCNIAKKQIGNSDSFRNTEIIKTDKFGKRKCYNFIFFVLLCLELCSELKFCDSWFIALEDIVLIFFTKPHSYVLHAHVFFLFSGFLSISLLLFYHFLN